MQSHGSAAPGVSTAAGCRLLTLWGTALAAAAAARTVRASVVEQQRVPDTVQNCNKRPDKGSLVRKIQGGLAVCKTLASADRNTSPIRIYAVDDASLKILNSRRRTRTARAVASARAASVSKARPRARATALAPRGRRGASPRRCGTRVVWTRCGPARHMRRYRRRSSKPLQLAACARRIPERRAASASAGMGPGIASWGTTGRA